jgi:hypothetical protein
MLKETVYKPVRHVHPPSHKVGYHYEPLARKGSSSCADWALWNNRAAFLQEITNRSNRMYIKVQQHFVTMCFVAYIPNFEKENKRGLYETTLLVVCPP